jgi:hypothetical protein
MGRILYAFVVVSRTSPSATFHRTPDNESSCTSSLTFVDGTMDRKVFRPPHSGTATTDAGTD